MVIFLYFQGFRLFLTVFSGKISVFSAASIIFHRSGYDKKKDITGKEKFTCNILIYAGENFSPLYDRIRSAYFLGLITSKPQ